MIDWTQDELRARVVELEAILDEAGKQIAKSSKDWVSILQLCNALKEIGVRDDQNVAEFVTALAAERDQLRAELDTERKISKLLLDHIGLSESAAFTESGLPNIGKLRGVLAELTKLREQQQADSTRLQWLIDNHDDAELKPGPLGWDVWVTTCEQQSVWLSGETARDAIDHAMRDADDVRENGTPYQQECDAEETAALATVPSPETPAK